MCCLLICLGGSTRKSVSSSEIPAEHLKLPSAQCQSAILNSVPTPQLMAPILGRRLLMQQPQFLGSRTWATFRMMAFRAFPRFPWTWGGNRVTPTILSQCIGFAAPKTWNHVILILKLPNHLVPESKHLPPLSVLHLLFTSGDLPATTKVAGMNLRGSQATYPSIIYHSYAQKKHVASQPRWFLFDRPWVSWASVASPGLFPDPTGWRSDLWVQGALPMQLLLEFLRRGVLSGTAECWCCCDGIKHNLPIILSLVLRKFLDPNP